MIMDIEKLKSICEESSQPIGNMDEFPLAKALHKSSTFRSNVGPQHVLELIKEIQTLRAKVASAELLVEALQTIRLANSDYTVKNAKATMQSIDKLVKEALATYDKQSEVKHDTE